MHTGVAEQNRTLRLAVAITAATALVLHGLELHAMPTDWAPGAPDAFGVSGSSPLAASLLVLAWGVGFAAMALFTAARFDRRDILVAGLFLAAFALLTGPAGGRLVAGAGASPRIGALLGGLTYALGTRFTQIFPRRLEPADVLARGSAPLARMLLRAPAALLAPRRYWTLVVVLELFSATLYGHVPAIAHVLLYCTLSIVYLTTAFGRGDDADRARIFWILEGVLVLFILECTWALMWLFRTVGLAQPDLTFWSDWLRIAEGWAALLCFGIALFRARAFDSGAVLRHTAVFSMTGVVTVVVFVAMEEAVVQTVTDRLGLGSGTGAVIGGVAAALAFRPVSEKLGRVVKGRGPQGPRNRRRSDGATDPTPVSQP